MTKEEFFGTYTTHLNKEQKEAVQAVEGFVLLLAVPGSGKTTVLVTRLGYMILVKKIKPENILTLTYTVAATKDMAERFEGLFGGEFAEKVEFRTINGICHKILNYYGAMTGKSQYELVTDEKELSRLVAELLYEAKEEYPTESEVSAARSQISYCKNRMLSLEEIKEQGKKVKMEELGRIYEGYQRRLKAQKQMDYDDQMVYAYKLLTKVPEVLDVFRKQYSYICVDEAQDTSKIQHAIISLLAGKDGNLFMVGDEDQSIYGFRAAYPEALLNFEKEHSGAKVLVMDKNYRSNAKIVAAADAVIRHNKNRHEKEMKAVRPEGEDIRLIPLAGRSRQYAYLMKVAQSAQGQVAVLYRDNESVVPLIDLLDRQGVAYRLKNSDAGFFTNRVVTDVCDILKLSLRPKDTELFSRVYYKLALYLTKQQAMEMCRISQEQDCPVLEAIEHCFNVKGNILGNCRSIRTHLRNMKKETPAKAISRIRKFMGYGDYLERAGIDEGKMDTLMQIAYQEKMIGGFLSRLEQLQKLFLFGGDANANFLLSTIHSSKGLEYEEVYLMDVCDGVFPKPGLGKSALSREEMEEERRLYYVGMTRAKEKLYIFSYQGENSCFVKEMGEKPKLEKLDFEPSVGMQVEHKAFGKGTIADITYEKKRPVSIVVEFQSGMKKFAFPMVFINGYMWRCQD